LNVDAVLTGSVLFSSNHVRITARLVKMPSERDVWAQSYEKDIQHPLQTQSEIAQSIADELRNILDRQQEDALSKPAGEIPSLTGGISRAGISGTGVPEAD
jgi:hypothetical protein